MPKLYLNKSAIVKNQIIDEKLLNLVEQEIARNERQSVFRSLYDLEIMGVVVYYRKNWRYKTLAQDEDQDATLNLGVRVPQAVF